jgi:hypothetical protein
MEMEGGAYIVCQRLHVCSHSENNLGYILEFPHGNLNLNFICG